MPKWALAVIVTISTAMILLSLSMLMRPRPGVIVPGDNPPESATVEIGTGERVLTPRPGLEGLKIPEFTLIDQDGDAVDESVLEGRVSIVAFIFTNCRLACPPMTANMLRLYHDLEDEPVRFVSISVDPVHDTPERLTEHASNLRVDTGRWMFLTGDEGEASRVVAEALDFDISADPDDANLITLADGSTMRNIQHPTKLFLVGPDRQILDFCSPTIPEDLARFKKVAAEVAG